MSKKYYLFYRRRLGIGGKRNLQELQAAGFFEDELSQISGPGFQARRDLFINGKTFTTATSLDIGIFEQKKLFPDNTVVDIEIRPNNPNFMLLSTETHEYKYEILDCKLYIKQYALNPDLTQSIQDNLNKGVFAKYNYFRNDLKKYYVPPGIQEYDFVLYTDKVPKRIFVGLVDAKAFHGHIGMSPFEFGHFDLKSIQINAYGGRYPSANYELNWKEGNFIRAYKDLSDTTDHGISLTKYAAHSCFYAFDLQAEHDSDIAEPQKSGTTAIVLNFNTPTPANGLQLIVYGEFESLFSIDVARNPSAFVPV